MNDAIDRRELFFKALAGLLGGAIGWIPVEIAAHGHFLGQQVSPLSQLAEAASVAMYAGTVGGMILVAEGNSLAITAVAKRRFLTGFSVCLLLGILANFLSNVIFNEILSAGGWSANPAGSVLAVVVGRTLGFSFMGLMLGAGVGLARLSLRNVLKGALGGLIGGFIGGAVFDLIGVFSQSGLASRLMGFCVIGLAIGFCIGLVHQLTKLAWLAVEAGRLKGRQFRLEGATVTVGRAEENAVGLFGDPGVQPRHAVISHQGSSYALKNLAVQAGTLVNGNRVETVSLHDGDRIKISNYELTFHLRTDKRARESSTAAAASVARVYVDGNSGLSGAAANSSDAGSIATPAICESAYLLGAGGQQFALRPGAPTRIGRALDNDIVVGDGSVSRHHASIEYRNGGFVLRDLGSQNGTWVGGQRVTESPLGLGDALRLGDASFTFHA